MTAAPPDHVTAVLSLLHRLGWNRLEDREVGKEGSGVYCPVFCRVLSARHPYPCLKAMVGATWVTYWKLVGEHTYDMDSVKTADLGTVEKVLAELTARSTAAVKR